MSVVAELKADLEQKRQGLIQEEDRLTQEAKRIEDELQLVRRYRQGLDEMLGQTKGKAEPGTVVGDTRQLQAILEATLKAVYPAGLATAELVERLQPQWTHGALTKMRMGALGRVNPAVVNDGSRWFWVPPEGAQET